LLQQELDLADAALAEVFGPQLLQIGRWGAEQAFLSMARTRRSALLDPFIEAPAAPLAPERALAVNSSAEQLAVANHCVDGVLLPHTLERSAAPHQVLREVDRILVGDGHLVILGINPLGAMGLRHLLSRKGFPPGSGSLIPVRRLRDWLQLLGFELRTVRYFCYGWPLDGVKSRRLERVEHLGARYFSRLSGAYLVHAQKRVYGMTPIRPALVTRPRRVPGLAEPSTRNAA
jgi:SAM-dependent methyltransferase